MYEVKLWYVEFMRFVTPNVVIFEYLLLIKYSVVILSFLYNVLLIYMVPMIGRRH